MAVNKLDITMMEDVGTSANQLVQRDGSGNLPAVDGSQISGVSEFTTSTSDPAIDTNPSGGVGSMWYNKTSGEMYVLTNATAGSNIWTNVGAGTGDVEPWKFQGETYGYNCGNDVYSNLIDRFSFTTDGNATDVGDLSVGRNAGCGNSAETHGYASGGTTASVTYTNVIDKFSFASGSENGSDVADLTVARNYAMGNGTVTYGYCSGGFTGSQSNIIEKFPYASNTNASDVGDLTATKYHAGPASSATYGYLAGGNWPSTAINVIEKFSFTTDGNGANVGDLTQAKNVEAGQTDIVSTSSGYCSNGYYGGGTNTNVIEKYSFTTDGNSTDLANLTAARREATGQSSTTHGYTSGGYISGNSDIIDKFNFAAGSDATDVGNLVGAKYTHVGQQV